MENEAFVSDPTMETADDHPGLLHRILPPRLEDAGLEDCALPPDSITEAFLKAVSAVTSRAAVSDDEEDEDCVDDPWEYAVEATRDEVVVGGVDVREVGGDKPCVDALLGLEIGERKEKEEEKKKSKDDDEGPILVGGYA